MFADDDGREYTHDASVLVTPVPCGQVGTEVWGCACGEAESYVEKEVTVARQHSYVEVPEVPATCDKAGTKAGFRCEYCGALFNSNKVQVEALETIPADPTKHDYSEVVWDWNVEMTDDNSDVKVKPTATLNLVCSVNPEHKVTLTAVVREVTSKAVKANCTTESNGLKVYSASTSYNGKNYTDEREVVLSYVHNIEWRYGVEQKNGNIKNQAKTIEGSTHHRAYCKTCKEFISDWEPHQLTEFTVTEENGHELEAKCSCDLSYEKVQGIRDAITKAQSIGNSVIRIDKTYDSTWSNVNYANRLVVPEGITLIVDKPFKVPENGVFVIEIQKGASIQGADFGENVVVVYSDAKSVVGEFTNANAFQHAIDIANNELVNTLKENEEVNVDLKVSEDLTLSKELVIDEKVNLTVTGTEYKNTESQKGTYYTIKSTKYTKNNMSSTAKNFIKNNGDLTLSNVAVRAEAGSGVEKEVATINNTGKVVANNAKIVSDYGTGIISNGELVSLTNTEVNSKGDPAIEDTDLAGVKLVENSADNKVEKLVMNNSKITNDNGDNVGIINTAQDSVIELTNTTIKDMYEGIRLDNASGSALTVNGGSVEITAGANALNVVGGKANGRDYVVNVSNCILTSGAEDDEGDTAVLLTGNGNYVFTDCTIKGGSGIMATQGTVTVNGGSITADGEYISESPVSTDGFVNDGCAISLVVGYPKYSDKEVKDPVLKVVVSDSTKLAVTANRSAGRLLRVYDKGNGGVEKIDVTAPVTNSDWVIDGAEEAEVVINGTTIK